MAEEILLDYILDQPFVSTSSVETQLKVLLNLRVSPSLSAVQTASTHICLVLDVSSSMRDREMRALMDAANNVVDLLREGDVLSLIAFQSNVYEVVKAERIGPDCDIASIKRAISMIMHYRGGGTDMEYALTKAEHQINSVDDPSLTRKILLLTDGRLDGIEERCLNRAAEISERGIIIDGLGFGKEFDYKFMQRLVSFSNGVTVKIDRPEDISEVFAQRVESTANAIANNVRMRLVFTPQVRAGRGYRYSPEMLYLGNIRLPADQREIEIPVGVIEKNQTNSYVLTFTVPQRPVGPIRAIHAELFYDIPALGIVGGSSQQSIVVQFTDDPDEASMVNGEVERAFDEVEIGRMVDELEKSISKKDHRRVSMFFDILAKRYTELGDEEMSDHYRNLKDSYMDNGELSQEEMNYNRHKATQKKESGVILVDASDLI